MSPFRMFFQRFRSKGHERLLLGVGYPYGRRHRVRPIFLDQRRLQNAHLIATGGSGSGKTAMLYSLAVQLIEQVFPVIVVFDPHGDLHNNLLNLLAQHPPEETARRLVLIEPYEAAQRGRYVGLNVLEAEEGQNPYELMEELVACYRVIWKDSWGERMGSILRNCFLLLESCGLTLVEMPQLLMESGLRESLMNQTSNEDVKAYFEFFNQFTPREQHLFVESARSRTEAFVQNPYLQPMLGQAVSTIRLTQLINQPGTVILVNASRNHLKTESRRLFCSLLFAKLHAAILARENIPEPERVPLFIFVDEAQEVYYPEAFVSLLTGGRKFNAHLNLFHQTLAQFAEFGEQDLQVLLANTGVKCVFQVNRKDAERYVREMFTFTGTRVKQQDRDLWGPKGRPLYYSIQEETEHAIAQLMQQQRREMIVQLKDNRSAAPYLATTPTIVYPQPCPERVEALREAVYQRHTRSADQVKAELASRREELRAAIQAQEEGAEGIITEE
jgi:hypothetical protein